MVFLLFTFSKAKEILVGGKENSWTLPSNSSESITHLDEWAKNTIFERGDILIFKFDPKKDSVLRVTEKNFNGCNTSKPLERYRNKKTLIELDQCKPFYFISGAKGHCQKGQKESQTTERAAEKTANPSLGGRTRGRERNGGRHGGEASGSASVSVASSKKKSKRTSKV
ncbi:early nodulin-like protein 1 [Morus notabilis]|uniref:early nodulin-like protein 1 n=1 Tax=Morus notabilis TaxID=981085 RepID=UPI000CECFB0A|nr:early nodulin-like protein 1 [Morus notabilis]